MKVLFDELGFRMVHGGVAKYFTELFLNFSSAVKTVLGFKWTVNYYLQQSPFSLPPYEYDFNDFLRDFLHGWKFRGAGHLFLCLNRIFPRLVRYSQTFNDMEFCRLLKEKEYDLVHLTAPHEYGKLWKKIPADKPVVVTVVDLIPELLQGADDVKAMRGRVLKRATRILTISKFTKQKILETYNVPESKIDLVYLGHEKHDRVEIVRELEGVRFVLFVGKRDDYKNFDFFVKAIAPILTRDPALKLVCTGGEFRPFEQRLFETLGVSGSVLHCAATDPAMTWLYRNARAFVYPSRMEGFGIPILDAFSAGCPVLLSRASCFPEIAQDAALYFELDNSDDLRRQLNRLLTDETLRGELIRKGALRVREFSWEKCARETEAVYRNVLEGWKVGRLKS